MAQPARGVVLPVPPPRRAGQGAPSRPGSGSTSGKAKPGVYNAYRLPFFVRLGRGRKIEVWGGFRSAGAGRTVTIQSRRGGKWRKLGTATTAKRGYFRKNFRVSGAGKRKYRFKAGGHTSVKLKAVRR